MRGKPICRKFLTVHSSLFGIAALFGIAIGGLALVGGCSSSEDEPPLPVKLSPREVRKLPQLDGQPLGHLKPLPQGKTPWPAGHTPPAYLKERPHVRWVLDGDKLTELDPPELLDSFRLDFDATRRLSFEDLPYVFMTEKSREVVIRRGDVLEGHFTDERISPDEKIVFVFACNNPGCPQAKKTQTAARFPHDPSSDQPPTCPFCGSKNSAGETIPTQRFKTSQYRGLEEQIYRQFYRDRERKKQRE